MYEAYYEAYLAEFIFKKHNKAMFTVINLCFKEIYIYIYCDA